MPTKDKTQTADDATSASTAGPEAARPAQKPLTREQLEAIRKKLQKKFH